MVDFINFVYTPFAYDPRVRANSTKRPRSLYRTFSNATYPEKFQFYRHTYTAPSITF